MTCSHCGHKIGAWNTDPYRIGDDVYCDRCWAAHGEELQAAVVQANREKLAAHKREYYQANREKLASYQREYYQANREKVAAHKREYRQRKKAAKQINLMPADESEAGDAMEIPAR